MAQEYLVKDTSLTAIADEIRVLSGKTGTMGLDTMASTLNTENTNFENNLSTQDNLISQIQTIVSSLPEAGVSEPNLQSKAVTPSTSSQTIKPDDGYDGLYSVTVDAMPTAAQATPSISISSSGLITASATQTAGYVTAGTESATSQLNTQAAKTITPSKSSQTAVSSGMYTTGSITVEAIPSQYITTIDATASADEIMSGETAYVNGSKITGTFTLDTELSAQDDLISQISSAVNNLPDIDSGGSGGSVETCTLQISGIGSSNQLLGVITRFIDGEFVVSDTINDGTYENVVCGSGLLINRPLISYFISAGTVLYGTARFIYQVPMTPNEIITISLVRD